MSRPICPRCDVQGGHEEGCSYMLEQRVEELEDKIEKIEEFLDFVQDVTGYTYRRDGQYDT